MSEVKKAFQELRKRFAEEKYKKLLSAGIDATETVRSGYSKVKPVYDDSGNKLTKIPDVDLVRRMTEAVTMKIGDSGDTLSVYLEGAEENKEAMRWYAYSNTAPEVANPFRAALKRLQDPNLWDKNKEEGE